MLTSELKPLMHTLAPQKVIAAYLEEASYAVSVQEITGPSPVPSMCCRGGIA